MTLRPAGGTPTRFLCTSRSCRSCPRQCPMTNPVPFKLRTACENVLRFVLLELQGRGDSRCRRISTFSTFSSLEIPTKNHRPPVLWGSGEFVCAEKVSVVASENALPRAHCKSSARIRIGEWPRRGLRGGGAWESNRLHSEIEFCDRCAPFAAADPTRPQPPTR